MHEGQFKLCLTTAPDLKQAREMAKLFLQQKLVACVNITSQMNSLYLWEGQLVEDQEFLLLMKTSANQLEKLEAQLHKVHPYQTPEFIVFDIGSGSKKYLDWLNLSLS